MKKYSKHIILLSLLTLIFGYGFFKPGVKARAAVIKSKRIDLQGHRGSRGLRPENTWPSFAKAIELGMTTLELDLNITADKKLIIYHDFALSRRLCKTINGNKIKARPIKTLTVAQLKELDCGLAQKAFPEQEAIANTKLITLSEFFQNMVAYQAKHENAKKVRFNLEIKIKPKRFSSSEIDEISQVLVNEMKNARVIKRSMVQSFNLPVLASIKKINNDIKIGMLFGTKPYQKLLRQGNFSAINADIIKKSLAIQSSSVNVHKHLLNRSLVSLAHQSDLRVFVWTVNDPYEIVSLFKVGVDGIITDYPNRLFFTWRMWQDVNKFKPEIIELDNELRIPEDLIADRIPKGEEARNLFLHMVSSLINKPLETIRIVK